MCDIVHGVGFCAWSSGGVECVGDVKCNGILEVWSMWSLMEYWKCGRCGDVMEYWKCGGCGV